MKGVGKLSVRYQWQSLRLRCLLILASVAGLAVSAQAAPPEVKVRLEMWEGCLCVGPDHAKTYEQLKGERAKRMLFGKDVTVTASEAKLAPLAFLGRHIDDGKLKGEVDFYWKGVVYRRGSDGQSYTVQFRGFKKLTLADFMDGDLIVYYRESY